MGELSMGDFDISKGCDDHDGGEDLLDEEIVKKLLISRLKI